MLACCPSNLNRTLDAVEFIVWLTKKRKAMDVAFSFFPEYTVVVWRSHNLYSFFSQNKTSLKLTQPSACVFTPKYKVMWVMYWLENGSAFFFCFLHQKEWAYAQVCACVGVRLQNNVDENVFASGHNACFRLHWLAISAVASVSLQKLLSSEKMAGLTSLRRLLFVIKLRHCFRRVLLLLTHYYYRAMEMVSPSPLARSHVRFCLEWWPSDCLCGQKHWDTWAIT